MQLEYAIVVFDIKTKGMLTLSFRATFYRFLCMLLVTPSEFACWMEYLETISSVAR